MHAFTIAEILLLSCAYAYVSLFYCGLLGSSLRDASDIELDNSLMYRYRQEQEASYGRNVLGFRLCISTLAIDIGIRMYALIC